jgi:hypothetical protein
MLVSFDLGLSARLWHSGRGDFEIVFLHGTSFAAHVPKENFSRASFSMKSQRTYVQRVAIENNSQKVLWRCGKKI